MSWVRILLVISGLIPNITSNGQTKDETQQWLSYHLERYFGDDYNAEHSIRVRKGEWWNPTKKYTYTDYQYSFKDTYLFIRKLHMEQDTTAYSSIKNTETDVINLKRILMVEATIDTINNTFIGVTINFSAPDYDDNDNLKEYSVVVLDKNGERLTPNNSYSLNYFIRSEKPESVGSRIEKKLAKGILHLAELNGAKVVKDLF